MSVLDSQAAPGRAGAVPRPQPTPARTADRLAVAPGPIVFVVVGLAYLTLAQVVMWLDEPLTNGATLWPAAGLGLAALMVLPTERWGWALGAIAVAAFGGDLAWGYSAGASVGWALSNTLAPLTGAILLRRLGNPRGDLVPVRQLLLFLAIGAVVGPFAGATLAAVVSALAGAPSFFQVWPDHFVGDALGVLLVAPVLLAPARRQVPRSRQEVTALLLSTATVASAVFTDFGGSWMVTMPYMLVPFFAWAALRFGTLGTACTSLGVAAVATGLTATGSGPFALAGGPDDTAVTMLQIFLAVTVSFSLLLAALVNDLSDRRDIEKALRHQATHDSLTGLPNRSRLSEELEAALSPTAGREGRTGLLVCDLDLFKAVNDRVGHKGGDELLVETANRLRAGVRPDDLVARISGDEFVVLLADVDEDDALRVARRLVDAASEPVLLDRQRQVRPSISIGAAVAEPGEDSESLFRVADAALYQAKRRGRGRVVVCDEALRRQTQAQIRDEDDMPTAFEDGQLICYFMPCVDLGSGRLTGAEAMVRWRHPELGLLDAERFLPTVEAMGWGDRLFETVLAQSLRAQVQWAGESGTDPHVSVNITALQLGSGGIVNVVLGALTESGARPEALCVEVTATSPLDDIAVAALHQLHALGVHLVLDAYGAGWSSMSRLSRIPWHMLKVDRAFVTDLGKDPAAADTVRAMVAMAKALGVRTGADGVTRIGQLETLVEIGCEVAQGPLFSRPETADEIGLMLESHRVWLGEDLRLPTRTEELPA